MSTQPQPLRPPLQVIPPQDPSLNLAPIQQENPIVSEIDQAHAALSPPAKAAIEGAHGMLGLSPQGTADNVEKAATPGTAAPAAPVSALSSQKLSFPMVPGADKTPAQNELQRIQSTGSGVSQIHNPFLRGLATVGDALGQFFPRISAVIPGTTAHHQLVESEAQRAANEENAEQKAADELRNNEARRGLEGAQTGEAQARAASLANPKEESEGKTVTTADGIFQWNPATKKYDTKVGEAPDKEGRAITHFFDKDGNAWKLNKDGSATPIKAPSGEQIQGEVKKPEPKEGELPLGDRVPQLNKAMEARYQVLHPGGALPPQFTLPTNATQKDYDRIDKALEGVEKAVGTKAQQDQANELRKQTMQLAQANREENRANREAKTGTELKQAVHKEYGPSLDSAERFNVMAKNYEDAVKNHDQQAMLSLLANHLGMTMGLQKGARMTKDIIQEAQQSRPWLQGMTAKFDKNGYLSGVTLTPEQMRQMVNLGRERFAEDISKSRNGAKYLGATDDGPDRTPNKATMNHYVALANGDATKAKDLAKADGWTVQ